MTAEYPDASWVGIPGFGFPRGSHGGNHPRWIVLHGTASPGATADNIARYFAGDPDNGTHFVIGKDGKVIQMVKLADAAYGNGGPTAQELAQHKYASFWQPEISAGVNLNTVTVSIEHCKDATDNSDVLTPAQQSASFKLVAWLCKSLGIPARQADASGGITGHFSINGIERANCPGPYPWSALWAALSAPPAPQPKGSTAQMLIQHPTDAGRLDLVYVAANGHVIHGRNNSDGLAGLAKAVVSQDLGAITSEAFTSAEASWSQTGSSLNVLATGVSGQLYAKALSGDGAQEMDWTPIAGQIAQVPATSAPELQEVQAIGAWLATFPKPSTT